MFAGLPLGAPLVTPAARPAPARHHPPDTAGHVGADVETFEAAGGGGGSTGASNVAHGCSHAVPVSLQKRKAEDPEADQERLKKKAAADRVSPPAGRRHRHACRRRPRFASAMPPTLVP